MAEQAAAAAAPAPAPSAPSSAPATTTAPASTPSTPAGGGGGAADDPAVAAARAFEFDPFGDNSWRDRFNEFDNPQTEQPAQPGAPDQGGAQAQPGAQPDTQNQAQPDAATALLARIAQAVERPVPVAPQSGQGAQPGQQADPYQGVPEYTIRIPEPWLQGLYSDDPAVRTQALQLTLSATARLTHARAAEQIRNEFARVLPQVVRHYVSELTETQNVSQGFYSQYPELNKDELRPLVVSAAARVMQETGQSQWSPQLAQAIRDRVYATFAGLGLPVNGQAAPAQTPAARPPTLSPGGARPGGAGGSNEIMRLLGL